MVLNSKGQVTIPAQLRAKYGLHAGHEVEVVEIDGALRIVRAEGLRPGGSGWSGGCVARQPARMWRA
jgi:AbrB family looped-hinge helix DNA binding protein